MHRPQTWDSKKVHGHGDDVEDAEDAEDAEDTEDVDDVTQHIS